MSRADEPYMITPRRTTALGNPYGQPQRAANEDQDQVEAPSRRRGVEMVDIEAPPVPQQQDRVPAWSEILDYESRRGKR